MILAGNAVQTLYRHALDGNTALAGRPGEPYGKVAMQVLFDKEFVDGPSGLDSLECRMYSENIIV